MYCNGCGAANIEEASFCRLCGMRLRETDAGESAYSTYAASRDLAWSLRKLITGIGFLLAAIIPMFFSNGMWWWFLFPGIPMVSKGLRGLERYRRARATNYLLARQRGDNQTRAIQPGVPTDDVGWVRPTGELVPPSVTENTTRLFEDRPGPASSPESPESASPSDDPRPVLPTSPMRDSAHRVSS